MTFSKSSFAFLVFLKWSQITQIHSTPEKPDCEWVASDKVERIRDVSDCSKFYYCVKGEAPYRSACPTDDHLFLYFNPNISNCDFYWRAPQDCFGNGGDGGGGSGSGSGSGSDSGSAEVITTTARTTTTTQGTTTTTKPPRPPILDDQPDFEIDCSRKVCGLFPNTYGPCNTYVICLNGEKVEKKCNGGQLFDVKTRECQPANSATCWTEPNAGPHTRKGKTVLCPFHRNHASQPVGNVGGASILQSPIVTNWGNWENWENCPPGKYATGIYAWKRLLQQGSKIDQAGITAVSFICQSPGGSETNEIIESLAPNLPMDGWPFYYMCKGAVVGIRLNSVGRSGLNGDQVATDNIQAMCSCSNPAYKPYEQPIYGLQSGNRGAWTAPQFCDKGQAVCGMQTQMHEYKEYMIGSYDNTGMNNMRVKCCNITSPFETCTPTEERLLIRSCDNSNSDEGLRCDFDSVVGYSMDPDADEKLLNFYSSVGYTFESSVAHMSSMIEDRLREKIKNGAMLEYTWDDITPSVLQDQQTTSKTMYLKEHELVELYQIVGRCSYFLVRTNRYLRKVKDGRTGSSKQQVYFEV